MHLLMASFRALPLDLMMPVSRRRIVWIFFLSYIYPFYFFFLASFHWLSQFKRATPLALEVRTHLHMRTSRNLLVASAGKSLVRLLRELTAVCRVGKPEFHSVVVVWGGGVVVWGGHITPVKQSLSFPRTETPPFKRRGNEERALRLWSIYQIIHLTGAFRSLSLATSGLRVFLVFFFNLVLER